MNSFSVPPGEAKRFKTLRSLGVLDTEPDEQFDALIKVASIVCETPISLVTLVDAERQWFKANLGLPGVSETSRDVAFCAHAILSDDLFEVRDATKDDRFATNPLVEGNPNIRFYAGMPLISQGHRLGTLCVIDRKPRVLNETQREVLRCLALAASRALEDRKLLKLQEVKDGLNDAPPANDTPLHFIRSALFINAIANATSDLIAYWDSDLRLRFANKAYADWFGISPKNIIGLHMKDVIGTRLFELNDRRIAQVLAGKEQIFENSLTRRDGLLYHVVVKYAPHSSDDGVVSGFYVSVVDITPMKQSALQLEATEARFRILSESSPCGVFHSDARGACSYTNQRWQEIFGLSAEDSMGHGWEQAVHPDDRQAVFERWDATARRPCEFDIDFRVIHRDGQIRHVRVRARAVAHPGAETLGFVGSAEDVTEREAARVELAESEARYRVLADASSDMIQRLDLGGRRQYVSPASREIFGLEPLQMIGTHPVDFIHDDDRRRVGALIDEVCSGRRDQARSVHRILHNLGHWIWIEAQFRLVRRASDGAPIEVVSTLRDISERESLQRRLAAINHNLLLAEEMAHMGHWRLDVTDDTVTWSAELYRIHGLDPATHVPTLETGIDLYHPDDRAEVIRCITEAVEQRSDFDFRLRLLQPSGEIRHVMSRGLCEIDEQTGKLTAIFGVLMDVTELVEAEREAREQSALLEATLDNMDQGLLKVSPDRKIELFNRRFAELLDLPNHVLDTGSPNFDKVLTYLYERGEFEGADEALLRRVRDAGKPLSVGTQERKRPTGQILEIVTKALGDGSTVSTYSDISARRQAESAVRASEARYRLLADATSDVITQLDLDLVRRYASPACRAMLGYEPEEMIGITPPNLIHPEDAGRVRNVMELLASGTVSGDRATVTDRMRHQRGHYVWIEANITLERDPDTGAPRSLICSLRDVTERQRAARHLDSARAAAENAARLKADFVANMSHELRTPLTAILGTHDLLDADPTLDPRQRRYIHIARDAGRALLAIVNDVLDFSKIEAGQLSIETAPFDLGSLVGTCRDLLRGEAEAKSVGLDVHVEGATTTLVGDQHRLRQVMLNLLSNAVKFTQEGRVGIVATYRRAVSRLRVEVSDTGIGIAEDKLDLLFERFSQADTSITRRYGGTGLGLAICKSLVELMGGEIGVVSKFGQGSTFWFELPLATAQGKAVEAGEFFGGMTAPPRRVLLAEDSFVNQEIIVAMISQRGHAVTVVADGAAAVAAARAGGFDVILMDVQMPVMDGLTATRAIRGEEAIDGRSATPIIGLTANALTEDIARCREAGMDAHVAKPIEWTELLGTIERMAGAPPLPKGGLVLDTIVLNDLLGFIGHERLTKMLDQFAADLKTRMDRLTSPTPADLAFATHALKSSAGQFGFVELSRLCAEVESEARQGLGLNRLIDLRKATDRAAEAAKSLDMSALA